MQVADEKFAVIEALIEELRGLQGRGPRTEQFNIGSPPPVPGGYSPESSPTRPVLMITTPGADPTKELLEFAQSQISVSSDNGEDEYQDISSLYVEIAMGGGMEQVAIEALRDAAENGKWLCLKNLHLVIAWLPVLEKELSMLAAQHENDERKFFVICFILFQF